MADRHHRYRHQFRPAYSRLHEDRDLRWVVPFAVRYVVMIVGDRFAGKSTALAYLSDMRGFRTYSLTDALREEASRRGLPLEPRSVLRDLGDELRAEHSDRALLARNTLRKIHRDQLTGPGQSGPPQRIAVGGFKRPEELALFQQLGANKVISVVADEEIRYQRAYTSGVLAQELESFLNAEGMPPTTPASFQVYIDGHDREGSGSPWTDGFGQAVGELVTMDAAHDVLNDGQLVDFYRQLDTVVDELDAANRTPGW